MFCILLLSFGPISIFNWSSCTPQKKKKVANIEPSRAGTTCQRSFDSVGKKSLSYWVNRFRSSQTHQLRLDVTLISQIICFKKKYNCCSSSLKFNHMWYEIFHRCYNVLLKFTIFKLVDTMGYKKYQIVHKYYMVLLKFIIFKLTDMMGYKEHQLSSQSSKIYGP